MEKDLFEKMLQGELQSITCPHQVDVVDNVMEQVAKQPLLTVRTRRHRWTIAFSSAAAAAAIALVVTTTLLPRSVDENAYSPMVVEMVSFVNDYPAYGYDDGRYAGVEDLVYDKDNETGSKIEEINQ